MYRLNMRLLVLIRQASRLVGNMPSGLNRRITSSVRPISLFIEMPLFGINRRLSLNPVLVILIGIAVVFSHCQKSSPKTIVAPNGGIACAEPQAAQAGMEVLEQGGTALDALITVAFSMAVTYPRAGNLGGGGFLVYRTARGEVTTIDFRETAPLKAHSDMYWDEKGNPVPEKSTVGVLAAGIPGTVKGLSFAHQKFGTLPWAKLLRPAIEFARKGFVVDAVLSAGLAHREERFKRFPNAYAIFFPNGSPPHPGDTLRQLDLAHTLELIARDGESAFYQGEIARKIVASVQKAGGIFTLEDFHQYRAVEREPVKIPYRDHVIYSMPPPSSGGLVLEGILNTLQKFDLAHSLPHNSPDYLALVSEVEKRWYAARNLYLADPDFVEIPYRLFSDPKRAAEVAASIDVSRPFPSQQMPEYRKMTHNYSESPQTTHISIVDRFGNAAAMTYTLNGSFGSHFVAEGTGILLNNEMDDFATKPGMPNMYGLVQGWANAIEPGKRMLSSMTPTIVEKEGALTGVLGTPGGSTIITAVLQVLLNKIDFRMSLRDAQQAARFHHQWLPDSIFYEQNRLPAKVVKVLQQRGFGMKPVWHLADIQAIWRAGDQWEISCDPRGTGFPRGY